jgi:heme exporter protein B
MTAASTIGVLSAQLKRELALAVHQKSDVMTPVFFFVVIASLFPLGIGADSALLQRLGPGVLWVSALLATLLSMPRMFTSDYDDGTLELMALSPTPLPLLISAKILAHIVLTGLPLLLAAPLLSLQYSLNNDVMLVLIFSLILGIPTLNLLGSIGAALTLGVRGAGVLLALLVLPLYIPVLIFGAGAAHAQSNGMASSGHLSLLAAALILATFLCPLASAAAIRIALE